MTTTKQTMIDAVKAYAEAHYNRGWDVVVECYEDDEIAEAMGDATTEDEAIVAVARGVGAWNDRRNDALGAGGLETVDVAIPTLTRIDDAPEPGSVLASGEPVRHPWTILLLSKSARKAVGAALWRATKVRQNQAPTFAKYGSNRKRGGSAAWFEVLLTEAEAADMLDRLNATERPEGWDDAGLAGMATIYAWKCL